MRNLTKRGRPRSVPLKQRSGPVFKIPIRDGGKREIDWPVAHPSALIFVPIVAAHSDPERYLDGDWPVRYNILS